MNLYKEVANYEKWLKTRGVYSGSIDYTYKAFILDNGLDKALNKIKFCIYNQDLDSICESISLNILDKQSIDYWLEDIYKKYGACALMESYRLLNAKYHRLKRLRDRVESIISYKSFFLTLTFTDEVLSRTSAKTRREYVTRYLKKISTNYVGNIDFGEKKGREHYHAVVMCDKIDSKLWTYGNLDFEKIIFEEDTSQKISKYVSKLVHHAIKETTKRNYLIYPKRKLDNFL